jgi:3-isopropylmalate/(R)-2-methylmalate dehydratase small subunit
MKAWVFGDDIDTDVIAPGRYMKFGIEEIARHCLEAVNPDFSRQVTKGDMIVAGRNFGCGSSREQAPAALKHLGIAALIADSFAGLFYRNALNLGLPALVSSGAKRIRHGDRISIDYARNEVFDLTSAERLPFEPIPAHLMEMVRDGGLLAHLEKRLKCRTTS